MVVRLWLVIVGGMSGAMGTRFGVKGAKGLIRRVPTATRVEAETTQRKMWDFPRFVKTVATFTPMPMPLRVLLGNAPSSQVPINLKPKQIIWSAIDNPHGVQWGTLDDVVMGGASESRFETVGQYGIFSGDIDEANNGGFVGARTLPLDKPFDASDCKGIYLKVKGDGKRYKCVIRDSNDFNGITWTSEFDTDDTQISPSSPWQVINLPFSSFKPTRFAQTLDYNALDSSKLWALQLVLSKFAYDGDLNPNFKAGPMRLLVESVGTY
ncbi:hypothetical protein AAMO2058_001713600 [Amorphochlora amoebiformis]